MSAAVSCAGVPGLVAGRALLVMRPALTIVLTNHKGGCGKTTSTANLGAAFAERGVRALPASEALAGHTHKVSEGAVMHIAHRPSFRGLPCQRAPGTDVTSIGDGRTRTGVRANGGKVGV